MDFNAPLNALWNYFNGTGKGATPPVNQAPAQQGLSSYTPVTRSAQTSTPGTYGPLTSKWNVSPTTGKPIADTPHPDEVTMDIYPTIHSLEPTKINRGKPWAGQKVPTGFLDGLAYAEAKARNVGGFDEDTLKQFLPLAARESRYSDYGNNGVNVDYRTPPPVKLTPLISKADALKAEESRLETLAQKAYQSKNNEAFGDLVLKRKNIKMQREKLDNEILSSPDWVSRANSYKDITSKAEQLGLKRSENQELIRDSKGNIISKVDVYRAKDTDPYAIKALHVPLALYNKKIAENPNATGLELTKRFVGAGEAAVARNKQEAHIGSNIYTHIKNKPVLDYYTQRVQHHSTKGKK